MARVTIENPEWETGWYPKKASTAFTKGQFVDLVSGFVQPSTSSSTKLLGVNQDNEIAASSTTTELIPILVPRTRNATVRATGASLVSTDVGSEMDLTDSQTVDRTASTNDNVEMVRFVSATVGIFKIVANET